jgi:hypothetical protein
MERIICFTLGLSEEDREKCGASFRTLNQGTHALDIIAVTEELLAARVGETLDKAIADPEMGRAEERPGGDRDVSRDIPQYRVVIIDAADRQQVLEVMRGFKAVLPDPHDMIFAVVTDTSRTWTFGEYIGHLGKEHEYMKTHDPAKDPDMKRM